MSRRRRRRIIPGKAGKGRNVGRQIALCILILLVAIIAKKMDTAIVQSTYSVIKAQFTQHATLSDMGDGVKSALGKLKDGTVTAVASLSEGKKGVRFSSPSDIEGTLSAAAAEGNTGKTVEYISEKEMQVYAAAGGTVSEIGKDTSGNSYIKIYHGNDMFSIYGGCTATYVQSLEKVKRGQILASVAAGEGNMLRFEIWNKGELIDPAKYLTLD
ncbi:hypothetical protein MASR2M70_01590 [Bacillota bacterium]